MIELTPELAARMLSIWNRRLLDDPGKVYDRTLLEEALGAPIVPGRIRAQHEQSLHSNHGRKGDGDWLGK